MQNNIKFKLILVYLVSSIYLISLGLTNLNPSWIYLAILSAGFVLGFMANESFFSTPYQPLSKYQNITSQQSKIILRTPIIIGDPQKHKQPPKKTRDQIISSMCLTYRHDYGLDKHTFGGMTNDERQALRAQMGQIFDNDIAPYMDFK